MEPLTPFEIQQIANELKLKKEDFFEFYKGGRFFLNPDKFKEILLESLKSTIQKVWDSKSDLYIVNMGREGSGKSLFSIWIAYWLSKEFGIPFGIDNIALNHTEWVALQDQLKKAFLIHDEAVESFSALEFQSAKGRTSMEIAIRNRVSQIINILNIPSLKYMHPYIREERLDMVWININLDVKKDDNTIRRIYLKFLLDKENSLKLVETLSKKHSLTKYELIGRARNGKKLFDFNVGGVFWIDIKNDESMQIFNEYDMKKKTTANATNSIALIKETLRNHSYYLIEYYKGSYSYIILYLLALFNIWVKLTIQLFPLNYINYSISLKYFLDLDPRNSLESNDKKKNLKEKDMRWFWIPKDFLDSLIDMRLFYVLVEPIIEELKFRRVEHLSNTFYKIDLTKLALLGENKTPFQEIYWNDLNNIDKFILASYYSKYLLNENRSVNQMFSFIYEIDNNINHQEYINKFLKTLREIYKLVIKNHKFLIKNSSKSVMELYGDIYKEVVKVLSPISDFNNKSFFKNITLLLTWKQMFEL
jgi:hypothetical protein